MNSFAVFGSRFCLPVLYTFATSACSPTATALLDLCRYHLHTSAPPPVTVGVGHLCQHCHRGTMRMVETRTLRLAAPMNLKQRTLHVLHLARMVSMLAFNPTLSLAKPQVSAVLPSRLGPVLPRSSRIRIHAPPGDDCFLYLAICRSHRSLLNTLPSPPNSKTSFNTHRS
jgi:hypothetical protein